ncbi:DUF305 domain-containing protein [Rhodoplanes sp. SY1]|uniref:DUF305 domain-containing protein n=1 Tax=Rhodoplanes sp. SY1 TaxID=3166646 RepID=UPI0038B502CD
MSTNMRMLPRSNRSEWATDWIAASLLGIVSSTFSTVLSTLGAGRIGRDAAVDWMVVASIPLGDAALLTVPPWSSVVVGILFHQWADFSWALVFFGLFGPWTRRLRPWKLAVIALPWAVFTSALEWLFLVPVFPFAQPIFTLEQPWWLGLVVHAFSAAMYPLFPWLRDRVAGQRPSPNARFAAAWGGIAFATILVFGVAAVLAAQGRELAWRGRDESFDQTWMRRMAAHHAQGVLLAAIAAERVGDPHLRAVAHLMGATQRSEIKVLEAWLRSWFGGALPHASADEHASMPGMIDSARVAALRSIPGADFDATFVAVMTEHHRGAVLMADEAVRRAGDVRLRIIGQVIRHAQQGEIALMHGIEPGFAAVRIGVGAITGIVNLP